MKFLSYLTELKDSKRQFQTLDKEEFIELAKGKFKESFEIFKDSKSQIYRGINAKSDFGYYPPRTEDRMSENTGNVYTLMINNSPKWKAYPKRNIICSTNNYTAGGYGNATYYVIPLSPNTKIGVCDKDDIWNSFSYFREKTGDWLNYINESVSSLLSSIPWDNFASDEDKNYVRHNRVQHLKDYTILKKLFGLIDKYKEELRVDIKATLFKNWLDDDADFFFYLDDLLDPRKNDIELMTFKKFSQTDFSDSEIWLNDECLLFDKRIDYNEI